MEKIKEIKKKAWSFSGTIPPNGAKLIAVEKVGEDKFYYYKDDQGNYWHQSESLINFEMQMRKSERKRREKRQKEKAEIRGKRSAFSTNK